MSNDPPCVMLIVFPDVFSQTLEQFVRSAAVVTFGAVGALVNLIVAVIVCKLTAEPPQEIQELVDYVRSPHGEGTAVSH